MKLWPENLMGMDYWEDPDVDGKIILDWILGKYGRKGGLGSSSSGWLAFENMIMNPRVP
jgi:hypothetical protein